MATRVLERLAVVRKQLFDAGRDMRANDGTFVCETWRCLSNLLSCEHEFSNEAAELVSWPPLMRAPFVVEATADKADNLTVVLL